VTSRRRRRTDASTGFASRTCSRATRSYQEYDPDGHHYEVYAATLEELSVRLEGDEFVVELDRTRDPADRMTDLLNRLK
jgi:hypothetical protein